MYDQYFSFANGERDLPTQDVDGSPVRDLYEQLQQRTGNLSADDPNTDALTDLKDRTLKLRKYDTVSDNFQKTFGSEISSAYQELGLTPPDFSDLSRSEALEKITEFTKTLSENVEFKDRTPAHSRTMTLLAGFKDLSPALMSSEWIEPFNANTVEMGREHLKDIDMRALSERLFKLPENYTPPGSAPPTEGMGRVNPGDNAARAEIAD